MRKSLVRDSAGNIVRNPDGSGRMHFDFSDEPADDLVVLFTGPISGIVAASDGTEYDVTDPYIKVASEHVDDICDAIHREHHAAGRFLDVPLPQR